MPRTKMPRLRVPRNPPQPTRIPAILRTRQRKVGPQGEIITPGMPRLWNAKRRIKVSKGLSPPQFKSFISNPDTKAWRTQVSPDVVAFADKHPQLDHDQLCMLLKHPSSYFSRSHNVAPSDRKQVYFPDFTVFLTRTPHNPPSFATFHVPLWFNKIDLKMYLRSLYNVETVHIRSYIMPNPVEREEPLRAGMRGKLFRPQAKKKMTAQLVEPFVWPEEITDFAEWEKEEYWRIGRAQVDAQRMQGQWSKMNPSRHHRKSVADQAMALMEGKRVWKPTWQNIPGDERVLKGIADVKPPPRRPTVQQTIPQRAPLRQIPVDSKSKRIPPIEAPVKEFEELRV